MSIRSKGWYCGSTSCAEQQLLFNQMLSPETTAAAEASKKNSFSWEPFGQALVRT